MPNHPVALELIEKSQRAIAAPSANKFGHVSPTKADHVLSDFTNNDVMILDGGQCSIGIESTVLKMTVEPNDQLAICGQAFVDQYFAKASIRMSDLRFIGQRLT